MQSKIFGEKIDLAVRLAPNELWRRVTATSDAKKIAFFAPSGFEGERRFLYAVCGSEIRVNLRQRRKGFPPILTMKIIPSNEGCQIRGKIAVEKSSWAFLMIFIIAFLLIGALPIYTVIGNLWSGQPPSTLTPFDYLAPVFLINATVLPAIIFFKVQRDMNELYEWIERLIANPVINPPTVFRGTIPPKLNASGIAPTK